MKLEKKAIVTVIIGVCLSCIVLGLVPVVNGYLDEQRAAEQLAAENVFLVWSDSAFPRVVFVDAHESQVNKDFLIDCVTRFPGLERLNVRGIAINDSDIGQLVVLTKLKYLDLSKTAITDKSVSRLCDFVSLEEVKMRNVNVTRKSVTAALLGRSNLNIDWSYKALNVGTE